MAIEIRGTADSTLKAFAKQLKEYARAHPAAEIELYRHDPYSVRIRIVDPDFRQKTRSMRHQEVWPILYRLPEDTLNELSFLVLVPPEERESALSSREFDDPLPSRS
jgi:stress-induced morphogen